MSCCPTTTRDPEAVLSNMRSEWGMTLNSAEADDNTVIGTISGDLVAISMIRSRVPGDEAEKNAANNYRWPEAVDATRSHRAHIIIALVNHCADLVACALTFTKVVESCCRLPSALGVYICDTVMCLLSYIDSTQAMKDGDLLLDNMVWFGNAAHPRV